MSRVPSRDGQVDINKTHCILSFCSVQFYDVRPLLLRHCLLFFVVVHFWLVYTFTVLDGSNTRGRVWFP